MDNEVRKPKGKVSVVEKAGVKITREYLCPTKVTQTFYIPAKDPDGKPIPEVDTLGRPKYVYGRAQVKEILCQFQTISAGTKSQPGKILCHYTLEADDPQYDDKFIALEKLRNDRSSMVMNQSDYDRWRNREAAEYKSEAIALKTKNEEQANVIAEMQKRIEELQKTQPGK